MCQKLFGCDCAFLTWFTCDGFPAGDVLPRSVHHAEAAVWPEAATHRPLLPGCTGAVAGSRQLLCQGASVRFRFFRVVKETFLSIMCCIIFWTLNKNKPETLKLQSSPAVSPKYIFLSEFCLPWLPRTWWLWRVKVRKLLFVFGWIQMSWSTTHQTYRLNELSCRKSSAGAF